MFGFRPEGRRIHDVDPIVAITPYLMPQRCDAQVFLSHDADYEPLMRYIAEKAREGHKITFMELLIASYVRGVSQVPETNRFIMNKQFYNRTELTVSFTLLMDTPDGSAEENAVKIRFDPSDTIFDVSARVKETIEKGRKADDPSFAIKLAKALTEMGVPILGTSSDGVDAAEDRERFDAAMEKHHIKRPQGFRLLLAVHREHQLYVGLVTALADHVLRGLASQGNIHGANENGFSRAGLSGQNI